MKLNLLPIFVILYACSAMAQDKPMQDKPPKIIAKCGDYNLEQYEFSIRFGGGYENIKHTVHEYQLTDSNSNTIKLTSDKITYGVAVLKGQQEISSRPGTAPETLTFDFIAQEKLFQLLITSSTTGRKPVIKCEVVH